MEQGLLSLHEDDRGYHEVVQAPSSVYQRLCKSLHNKGGVERLVRFVKSSFMIGRMFGNITDLNIEAIR